MNSPVAKDSPAGERILVRGVNWLGDSVMSIPALRRLREAKPGAHITLLASEKLTGLWEGQPYLDEVLYFSATDSVWKTARQLRAKSFSRAIAFPNSVRSALELWLAGIPQRTGYARPWRTQLLTDRVPPRPGSVPMRKRTPEEIGRLVATPRRSAPILPEAHHAYDYLHLVAALGASPEPIPPLLTISQDEAASAAARFGMVSPNEDRPCFGMAPGAEYGPAKRWPVEEFAGTARAVHKVTGCRWILFGGPGDAEIAQAVALGIGPSVPAPFIINLAGKTTLRELAAALKSCRLLLTNDSGPMHLAAAVGTPVIVPFGSTSPEMTGPFMASNATVLRAPEIPCAPCFRRDCPIDFRCMRNLPSSDVADAIMRAFRRRPSP